MQTDEIKNVKPLLKQHNVSGRFSIGKQFQRNPDSENGLILLTITGTSKYKVELGSYGWKSKKWLSANLFNAVCINDR
jgi:hypothetical protein